MVDGGGWVPYGLRPVPCKIASDQVAGTNVEVATKGSRAGAWSPLESLPIGHELPRASRLTILCGVKIKVF